MLKLIIIILLIQNFLLADRGDFEKVTLQLQWKHQFQFAGYYMAKEKGFYKQAGIKVELKEFGHGISPIDVVTSNKATYGTGRSSLIRDKSEGKGIKLISAIFQSSPLVLMVSPKSNIKNIKDMKGKTIMLSPDESTSVSINAMLTSQGISQKDLNLLKHTFEVDDLINGITDISSAYISAQPYRLIQSGIKPIVFDPKDYGFDFYNDILFTSDEEVKNNPNRVKRFKEASLKGWEYAFSNIEETVNIIKEKYNTQNKTKDELIYEANKLKELAYYKIAKIGNINKQKIKRIYDIYNLLGFIKERIDFEEFIFNSKQGKISLTFDEEEYIQKNKVIRMCNNSILSPIEFANNGNQDDMRGISIDTLKLIESQLDISFINVATKDWGESQQFLKEKKCDILSASLITSQRAKFANFTKPYLTLKSAIFTRKDSASFVTFDDVADKSMSQIRNSGVSDKLLKEYPKLTIIETSSAKEAMEYVNNGKVFFSTGFAEVGVDLMVKYALDNVHIAGYTKDDYKITIAVRDDDILLLNILNKALSSITAKEYRTIYRKWVTPVIKEKIIDYSSISKILIVVLIIGVFVIYRQWLLKKQNKILGIVVNEKTKELKNINENLKGIIEDKTKELQKSLDTMSKYIIFSRTNLQGVITDASDAFIETSQYTKDELIGMPHNIIRHPDMPKSAFENMWETIKADEVWRGEVKNRKKDGSYYWIEADISPEYDKDNNKIGYIAIRHEITAKKDFEEQHMKLMQSEKLASMGEMIGNIAHQWRQPLSIISTAASGMIIKKEYDILKDEEFYTMCNSIEENSQFLSKTIDEFRDYISGDSNAIEFNLKNDCDSFLRLVDSTIKEFNIDVILDLEESININGYPNKLIQCFISIFNNAKEALVQNNREDDRYIFISQEILESKVKITFKDNAGGIENDIISKVFEPYFTTKHQSIGIGLGLHMTYNLIVNVMNGEIEAINEEFKYNNKQYKGAKFIITIPLK